MNAVDGSGKSAGLSAVLPHSYEEKLVVLYYFSVVDLVI